MSTGIQSYPVFCRRVIRSHDAPAAACAACGSRVKTRAGTREAAAGPEPPLTSGQAASRTERSIASSAASLLKWRPFIPGSGRPLLPRMMRRDATPGSIKRVGGSRPIGRLHRACGDPGRGAAAPVPDADGGLAVTGRADQSPSLAVTVSKSLSRTVANEPLFYGVIGRRALKAWQQSKTTVTRACVIL